MIYQGHWAAGREHLALLPSCHRNNDKQPFIGQRQCNLQVSPRRCSTASDGASSSLFNHASAPLPNFHQHMKCCTWDNKTLCSNTAGTNSSLSLPPLGYSGHNLIRLLPVDTPGVKRQPTNNRHMKQRSEETSDALRGLLWHHWLGSAL